MKVKAIVKELFKKFQLLQYCSNKQSFIREVVSFIQLLIKYISHILKYTNCVTLLFHSLHIKLCLKRWNTKKEKRKKKYYNSVSKIGLVSWREIIEREEEKRFGGGNDVKYKMECYVVSLKTLELKKLR